MLSLLPPSQRGTTMVESLVAIVVMALGVLGLLGLQMRTLADTQTGVRRTQAIRLMEDLAERIRTNPSGLALLGQYTSDWGDGAAPAAPSTDCMARACSSTELAVHDKNLWLQTVRRTLPLGDAAVFLVADETHVANRRQLGVMISWRENENTTARDAAAAPAQAFTTTIRCPPDRSCHLQYIQPGARCLGRSQKHAICPG